MASGEGSSEQLDRYVGLARPVALLLALLALYETAPSLGGGAAEAARLSEIFLGGYLAASVVLLLVEWLTPLERIPFRAEIDALFLAAFVALTPSLAPFWFFYLFVVFAMATRRREGEMRATNAPRTGNLFTSDAAWLSLGAAAAVVVRAAWLEPASSQKLANWTALAAATYLSGLCVAWLGTREKSHAREDRFLENLVGLLRVEKGLAESARLALSELAREFDAGHAYLVICDEEIERLFVWKGVQDRRHAIAPDVLPLMRAGAFLAEDLQHTVCWNSLEGAGRGFAWQRETGKRVKGMEAPPATLREGLKARNVIAATILAGGQPSGRMLVMNARGGFSRRDLRWFERIVRHLNAPLENIFLLRSLRTRAVEAERSRISRDLHDGILQTLLSLNIQLGVLRKRLPEGNEQAGTDLEALERTVRQEGEDLRQMVKDLRPLRVESADLREMMYGFAERYHNESGLAVDLFLEENDLRAPDRVCREVFQIYRESLNNIKKHARASHVVVKLWQDDTKVFLVVDDNGQGFSFSGRYNSEELDRLRLGPISIKERTRSVGGVLTVESNPGHGARLTIEIPLN